MKMPSARPPLSGVQLPRSSAAGAAHDAGCSGEALRLLRRHGLQRRSEFLACKDHRRSGLRGLGHSLGRRNVVSGQVKGGALFRPTAAILNIARDGGPTARTDGDDGDG